MAFNHLDHLPDGDLDRDTIGEWVPVGSMFVAPYGRPVSQAKINNLLRAGFDLEKVGVILVSLRDDGRYAILDGNHRVQAARQVGITAMPCRVFLDKTYREEAELYNAFATVNKQTALDRFRARLEAGELAATEIDGMLRRHGMRVAIHGPGVGAVAAVFQLDTVYTHHGPRFLAEVVDLIYDAWDTSARGWTSKTLAGMTTFWMRYRTTADRARLVDRLRLHTPEILLREAGLLRPSLTPDAGSAIGRAIWQIYNTGLRSNALSDWVDRPGKALTRERAAPASEQS